MKLVAIDETEYWDEEIVKVTGRIWGIYAYDETIVHHCCEVTPSYELYFIHNETQKYVEDDDLAMEIMYESSEDWSYVHCNSIEGIEVCFDYDSYDSYVELMDDVREYYRGNHIDLDLAIKLGIDYRE